MTLPTHFTLNTGAKIPAIGLGMGNPVPFITQSRTNNVRTGTWQSQPGEVRKAVAYALKDGYRHIDAAL
jgi:glycerol 2-dehydrogenase (NADP+)